MWAFGDARSKVWMRGSVDGSSQVHDRGSGVNSSANILPRAFVTTQEARRRDDSPLCGRWLSQSNYLDAATWLLLSRSLDLHSIVCVPRAAERFVEAVCRLGGHAKHRRTAGGCPPLANGDRAKIEECRGRLPAALLLVRRRTKPQTSSRVSFSTPRSLFISLCLLRRPVSHKSSISNSPPPSPAGSPSRGSPIPPCHSSLLVGQISGLRGFPLHRAIHPTRASFPLLLQPVRRKTFCR